MEIGERGSGVPQTPPAPRSLWQLPGLRELFGEGKGVKASKGVGVLESLTWERVGEEEDPEGSHSQNVRGELGWGVRRLFVLYFLGRGG